jgi:hypothetical protein
LLLKCLCKNQRGREQEKDLSFSSEPNITVSLLALCVCISWCNYFNIYRGRCWGVFVTVICVTVEQVHSVYTIHSNRLLPAMPRYVLVRKRLASDGFRNNSIPELNRVIKRCSLSWLTNSTLVYEPYCEGRGGVAGSQLMSTAVHRSPNKRWRKGTVSRDFLLLVFFMNQFPPSP